MKPVKCVNNHYFDGERYDACPHCGATVASDGAAGESKKGFSIFSPKKKNNAEKTYDTSLKSGKKTVKTVGLYDSISATSSSNDSQVKHETYSTNTPDEKTGIPDSDKANPFSFEAQLVVNTPEVEERTDDKKAEMPQQTQGGGLASAIKNVSTNAVGKTVGFFNASALNGQASSGINTHTEPVVGWLVCIKGPHFGESFNIVAGRNAIGRDTSNKIVLFNDNQVSRSKHAWITYEPKKREFYIQPGESSGLSYLNDENIMESKKLKEKDRLELGAGIYLFVPLCNSEFSWDEI